MRACICPSKINCMSSSSSARTVVLNAAAIFLISADRYGLKYWIKARFRIWAYNAFTCGAMYMSSNRLSYSSTHTYIYKTQATQKGPYFIRQWSVVPTYQCYHHMRGQLAEWTTLKPARSATWQLSDNIMTLYFAHIRNSFMYCHFPHIKHNMKHTSQSMCDATSKPCFLDCSMALSIKTGGVP